MDRDKLVTIAVTAIVSVTFTELVRWLLSLAKAAPATAAVRKRAGRVFNRSNWGILVNVVGLVFAVPALIYIVHDPRPPTRRDIFWISLAEFNVILLVLLLMAEIVWKRVEAHFRRVAPPNAPEPEQSR